MSETLFPIMDLLKKAALGVLANCPDLRAYRLGPRRAVSAHIQDIHSASKNGCGLPFDQTQGRTGRPCLNRPEAHAHKGRRGKLAFGAS